jgi:hypothetical protein
MDAKLKLKLDEAVEAALAKWKRTSGSHLKTGLPSPKTGLASPESESNALNLRLARLTRRQLSREAQWRRIQAELAVDALVQIFARKLKPRQSADENQLTLPGFEHLPKSVRIGKTRTDFLKLPVPQFLDYETKYQLRAQRDRQTGEELQRLAAAVTPYTEAGLTVAEAFERAQAHTEPSNVVVLAPRSA